MTVLSWLAIPLWSLSEEILYFEIKDVLDKEKYMLTVHTFHILKFNPNQYFNTFD